MQNILAKVEEAFSSVHELVKDDLSAVNTGRARPDLVAQVPIKVESYGASMPLQELASISAPDVQMLLISPWDKNIIGEIEKGLKKSERNLNPRIDGEVIRINILPLNEETRRELAKLIDKKIEAGKRLLRQERRTIKQEIDDQKDQPGVSEDDVFRAVEELDQKTREWEGKIDEMGNEKKKEVLTL